MYIFQIDYPKEAAKMMTQYNLPVDAPEFVRAKETAKNASDVSCCFISCTVRGNVT